MVNKKSDKKAPVKSSIKSKENDMIDEEMTSPEVTDIGSFNTGKFILGLVIGFIGLLVVLLAVFSYTFYKQPDISTVAGKVAKAVNLPLASVNGEFISYGEFYNDYEILSHYYNNGLEKGLIDPSTAPSDNELKSNILNQLVNKALIDQLADEYGLVVSDIEVETAWQKEVLAGFNTPEEAVDTILEAYNMTVDQFKNKVVRENLVYNKLSEAVGFDTERQSPYKEKAEEILTKLNAGESFEELATQYSEDEGTVPNGGDLGFFPRGMMVPEFEAVAFALDAGETSDVVKTNFGYHIIRVVERKEASEDGEQAEQVHAKHILIKGYSLDVYLEEMRNSDDTKKYVNFLEV